MRSRRVLVFFTLMSCSSPIDMSLSVSDYQKKGVASITRPWNSIDYKNCALALEQIKAANFHSLPRLESFKSGEILQRIVSEENLDSLFTNIKKQPYELNNFISAYGKVLSIYLVDEKDYYHRESAELMVYLIKLSNYTFINLGIPSGFDENLGFLTEKKRELSNGYKTMISGILDMQRISRGFTEEDQRKLSSAVVGSLKLNIAVIDSEIMKEIHNQIDELSKTTKSASVKEFYITWLNSNKAN